MNRTCTRWITALSLVAMSSIAIDRAYAYGQCRAPRQPDCLKMLNFSKDEFSIRSCRQEVDFYRQQVESYARCMVDEVNAERAEQTRNVEKARARINCYEQGRNSCF